MQQSRGVVAVALTALVCSLLALVLTATGQYRATQENREFQRMKLAQEKELTEAIKALTAILKQK